MPDVLFDESREEWREAGGTSGGEKKRAVNSGDHPRRVCWPVASRQLPVELASWPDGSRFHYGVYKTKTHLAV